MKNKTGKTDEQVERALFCGDDEAAQRTKLSAMAKDIVSATVRVSTMYLDLCGYIRSAEVAPKVATEELIKAGFNKVRTSEIVRVAHSADAVWSKFKARSIGFRGVLEIERGNVVECLAAETGDSETDIRAEAEESEEGADGGESAAVGSTVNSEAASVRKVELAAVTILKFSAAQNLSKKSWTYGDGGYVLTVTRSSKKPKKGETKNADTAAA